MVSSSASVQSMSATIIVVVKTDINDEMGTVCLVDTSWPSFDDVLDQIVQQTIGSKNDGGKPGHRHVSHRLVRLVACSDSSDSDGSYYKKQGYVRCGLSLRENDEYLLESSKTTIEENTLTSIWDFQYSKSEKDKVEGKNTSFVSAVSSPLPPPPPPHRPHRAPESVPMSEVLDPPPKQLPLRYRVFSFRRGGDGAISPISQCSAKMAPTTAVAPSAKAPSIEPDKSSDNDTVSLSSFMNDSSSDGEDDDDFFDIQKDDKRGKDRKNISDKSLTTSCIPTGRVNAARIKELATSGGCADTGVENEEVGTQSRWMMCFSAPCGTYSGQTPRSHPRKRNKEKSSQRRARLRYSNRSQQVEWEDDNSYGPKPVARSRSAGVR